MQMTSELERFIHMFAKLDREDQHELIGEMKAMLFTDKYQKGSAQIVNLSAYQENNQMIQED